jgi:hypothetical protein
VLETDNGVLYHNEEVIAAKKDCSTIKWLQPEARFEERKRWDDNICPHCAERFVCYTQRDDIYHKRAYLLKEEPTGNDSISRAIRKWCYPYIIYEGIQDEHKYCKKDIRERSLC